MAGTPTAEKPPAGLSAHWLGVWRHALKTLKAQGSWEWEQAPLLAEYVYALVEAERARLADEQTVWDRSVKRASALADQLLLTPRGRKAVGLGEQDDDPEDQFAGLDGADELAAKRKARSA